VIYVVVTVLVAKAILYAFERYLVPFASRTRTRVDYIILTGVKRPVYILSIVLGVNWALGYIEFPYMEAVSITFMILIVLLAVIAAFRIIPELVNEYGRYASKKRGDRVVARDVTRSLNRLVRILIAAVGIMAMLNILNINVTPLIAGMGIAGIAFALAAQDSLSNMFSGFYLMVDKPFRLGDRLILAGGEIVEVRDVGIRSTRLYNVLEHTLITVPNAELSRMTLTNISEPDIKFRLRVKIGVAYGSNVPLVKETLLEVARATEGALEDPAPMVVFEEFGDFSLNFQLMVWIADVRQKLEVLDQVNTRINQRFEEEGIEIPFPITTVHMGK
jgi:small-conductance mechanosensitive channel